MIVTSRYCTIFNTSPLSGEPLRGEVLFVFTTANLRFFSRFSIKNRKNIEGNSTKIVDTHPKVVYHPYNNKYD